jgi:hypothetical protein
MLHTEFVGLFIASHCTKLLCLACLCHIKKSGVKSEISLFISFQSLPLQSFQGCSLGAANMSDFKKYAFMNLYNELKFSEIAITFQAF